MNNVIGVFDSTGTADQVIRDLTSSGFSSSAVTRYEGGSDLESRLTSAGVEADEAREYAASVSQGGALVVAQAEDSQTDEAVAIMNRYYKGSDSDAQYAAGDTQTVADSGETRLAVAEEQLMVGKREVSRGGVRVRSVVSERPVEAQLKHFVANEHADAVLAHLSGRVAQNLVIIFQFHAKHRVRQQFDHLAAHFQKFFFRHQSSMGSIFKDARP